ncbi:stimulated by retinoic acid gene 6 protein-like isoform X2 [Pan troglodytes]|uniref:stimulated by retinoic acid gene 6 protein-like isoform X2 n=1 Tax=Pan troglodytes TaxID=9598 RepID=UPI0007DBA01D|nr:stimulated by retinoic acid gene 6 protein-like isoform X2 [Pan troglodytes]
MMHNIIVKELIVTFFLGITVFVGKYETLVFYRPSLLCLAFLLGRFLHMFVKALRVHLGWELQVEEKSVPEAHQGEHVKQLLRIPRPQERKKSWFQTRIYEWDPCFQFPGRMIGTIVLAFICLYLESGWRPFCPPLSRV